MQHSQSGQGGLDLKIFDLIGFRVATASVTLLPLSALQGCLGPTGVTIEVARGAQRDSHVLRQDSGLVRGQRLDQVGPRRFGAVATAIRSPGRHSKARPLRSSVRAGTHHSIRPVNSLCLTGQIRLPVRLRPRAGGGQEYPFREQVVPETISR